MVITVIALLALIIFIVVGVMARKNQEKSGKIREETYDRTSNPSAG